MLKTKLKYLLLLGLTGLLTSCGEEGEASAKPSPQQMPKTAVDIELPVVKDLVVYNEFSGRTAASETVEVIPRVSGLLEKKHFTSGQYVKKGQLLFTIDKEKYAAAVSKAKSIVGKAEADVELKTVAWKKRKKVFDRSQGVSEIDVLVADAERKVANSELKATQVSLEDALRDLRYTEIIAPISGRISKSEISAGNLIAAESSVMATITQDDPLYFNFEVSERAVLPYLKLRPKEGSPIIKVAKKDLQLRLSDGSTYSQLGKVDFVANGVDDESGSYQIRARFENPKGVVSGGLFARVAIPETINKAVLVKKLAVLRDLSGYYVFLVNKSGVVEKRNIVPTSYSEGALRVIEPYNTDTGKGVKAGEQVVVSNLQKIGAGAPVTIISANKSQ